MLIALLFSSHVLKIILHAPIGIREIARDFEKMLQYLFHTSKKARMQLNYNADTMDWVQRHDVRENQASIAYEVEVVVTFPVVLVRSARMLRLQ